jgi:hypothetical protein
MQCVFSVSPLCGPAEPVSNRLSKACLWNSGNDNGARIQGVCCAQHRKKMGRRFNHIACG